MDQFDCIYLCDYIVLVEIGVFQIEWGQEQCLCFNIQVELVIYVVGVDDEVDCILFYDILIGVVVVGLVDCCYDLLEMLVEKIVVQVLVYLCVVQVSVMVEKLDCIFGVFGVMLSCCQVWVVVDVMVVQLWVIFYGIEFLLFVGGVVLVFDVLGLLLLQGGNLCEVEFLVLDQVVWVLVGYFGLIVVVMQIELEWVVIEGCVVVWVFVCMVCDVVGLFLDLYVLVLWLVDWLQVS